MFLTGVWEPNFIERLLLRSLYLINYAAIALIIILVVYLFIKIKKKEQ